MIPTPERVGQGRECWYVWLFERPSGAERRVAMVTVPR